MVLVDRIESAYRKKKHKGEKETCHHCWKDARIVMEVLKETMKTREQIEKENSEIWAKVNKYSTVHEPEKQLLYAIFVRLGDILDMMPNPYDQP